MQLKRTNKNGENDKLAKFLLVERNAWDVLKRENMQICFQKFL